jgi:glycosyltransferase involved in cell wall biosynthesis
MSGSGSTPESDVGTRGAARILVDCTQTYRCAATTGIPRVVRNLVSWGRRVGRPLGVEVLPIRFEGTCFVPVAVDATDTIIPQPEPRRDLAARVAVRLRKLFVSRHMRAAYHRAHRRLWGVADSAVRAGVGDVILLPDGSWDVPMWESIDVMRDAGALLGVVQHDFIPLRHPDIVPERNLAPFRAWAAATLGRADFVMAVSETIAAEARDELRRLGRHDVAADGVSAFRNGSDFDFTARPGPLRRELVDFLHRSPQPPYLTVGTIEPRKNQSLLLDAIDRILAEAPQARFLIAGIVGWRGEPIVERMQRHPGWMRQVAHFADLTDGELAHAYHHAKALVFPSLAEGFGLPIVEAIAAGTQAFVSDIPVHRETGGEACVFFDPHDAAGLARRLVAHSTTGHYPARWPFTGRPLPRWSEAATHVVQTSLAHLRRRADARRPDDRIAA